MLPGSLDGGGYPLMRYRVRGWLLMLEAGAGIGVIVVGLAVLLFLLWSRL
jgi:hypothetical protein